MDENTLFEKRLVEGEIGQPYTDVSHGFKIGEKQDIWYIIPPEVLIDKGIDIGTNQVVLIYDLVRKLWFGGRIKTIEIRKVSDPDRERKVYNPRIIPMVEYLKAQGEYAIDPLLAQIELICMIEKDSENEDKLIKKPVTTCPTNASILLIPQATPQITEPSLSFILGLPERGIPLGVFSQDQKPYIDPVTGDFLVYYLDLDKIQNKHMLVVGSTGQGKTALLKHLIRQLNKKGYAILAFDIQGDIIQVPFDVETFNKLSPPNKALDFKDIETRFHEVIGDDSEYPFQVRILFPVPENMSTSAKRKMEILSEISERSMELLGFSIEFVPFTLEFNRIKDAEHLIPYMPTLTNNAADVLARLFKTYRPNTLEELIEIITNAEEDRRGNYYIQEYLPDYPIHGRTYENLVRSISSLQDIGIFDVNLSELETPEFVEPNKISIVYLEHLTEEQKKIVEHFIIYEIYRHKDELNLNIKPGVFIIIDEAHSVIPRQTYYGESKEFTSLVAYTFSKIAREGRKYGINLIVSTHSPKDIHQVVYDLVGTKICFRIPFEDAKELGMPNELTYQLPQYNKGFALVNSPENGELSMPWIEVKMMRPNCVHVDPGTFFEYLEELLQDRADKAIGEDIEKKREYMKKFL